MPVGEISSIKPGLPTTPTSKTGRSATTDLGKDDFLQLLIAQLRNQDPLKPMEDREFVAQLAQFRTLEQMDKMSASLERLMQAQQVSFAGSLIGRTVQTKDGLSGAVQSVAIKDGVPTLEVNDQSVALDVVTEVR